MHFWRPFVRIFDLRSTLSTKVVGHALPASFKDARRQGAPGEIADLVSAPARVEIGQKNAVVPGTHHGALIDAGKKRADLRIAQLPVHLWRLRVSHASGRVRTVPQGKR